MKDILRIVRLDYITVRATVMPVVLMLSALCAGLSLLIAPMCAAYIQLVVLFYIVPLQNIGEKSGFHKLYGILPVKRKNITRGRFLFLAGSMLLSELEGLLIAIAARELQLYRFLPNQGSSEMQLIAETFSKDSFLCFGTIAGLFAVLCISFSYMEMMGQIFGRENEMKIILITLGAVSALAVAFFELSNRGILPIIRIQDWNLSFAQKCLVSAGVTLAALALNVLFGEITADKIAKREL